ncbi:MAG: glutamine-hydrolyzing GMP synthase, partial [Vallitaleaceae bacterium]|nr:glutamine-hydrolyzing GMP synthase [Vallitaleaceae bacterium]
MKKIVVFDYGSQYNHLITRRIRDFGVYSELWNPELDIKKIQNDNDILGIILSGGPNSIYKQDLTNLDKTLFGLGIPILGICYGMQLIASVFGAKIIPAKSREYGRVTINVNPSNSLLFEGVNPETDVFMSHKDMIETPPQGFVVDAKSQACPIAAFHQANTKIYGVQFHPEVVHTSEGNKILKNFVFGICKSEPNWSMDNFIAEEIIRIKEITNGKKVLLGLSGGVDSTVAAVLLYKAIGEKLTCMLVDHGLLRKDEVESVTNSLKNKFSMQVVVVDAKKRFLDKLSNVTDPEKKRK